MCLSASNLQSFSLMILIHDLYLFRNSLPKITLYYPRCNQIDYDQLDEYKIADDIWISPGQIQYYKISANYFFGSKDLRLRVM